jgi:hypothetical protein
MNFNVPTVHDGLFIGTSTSDPLPLPFDELLAHHADVRDATGRTMHKEHDLAPDLATFISMLSFLYAFNNYKALGLLLPELYHESAALVLRQLWEVSLNLHWIERDPPDRAQDFCNFTVMEYRKLLQKSGRSSQLQDFDDATKRFQAKFRTRDAKGRNQRHSVFALKNVHERADELGDPWTQEYELLYHLGSLHAHGAPGAILQPQFQQHYSMPEVRERNAVALLAIESINVLVRDVHLLVRLGALEDCDDVDKAFASFQSTMGRTNPVG